MDDRGGGPARRVGPAQPGDPRRLAGERPLQRLDLARRAAALGVGLPLVGQHVVARAHDAQVQVVRARAGARRTTASRRTGTRCRAARCRRPAARSPTTCTSTASPKLAVTTRPSPKASPAQRRTSAAVLASRSGSTPTVVAAAVVSGTDPFNHEFRQIRSGIGQIDRPGRPRLRRSTTHRASPTRCCSTSTGSTCWWSAPDRSPPARSPGCTPPVPTCASWRRGVAGDAGPPRRRPGPPRRRAPLRRRRPRRRPPRGDGDGSPRRRRRGRRATPPPAASGSTPPTTRRRARSSCPPSPATGRSPSPWAPTAPARRSPAACATWPGGCSTTTWWRWPPASPPNVLRCAPGADRPRTSTGAPRSTPSCRRPERPGAAVGPPGTSPLG